MKSSSLFLAVGIFAVLPLLAQAKITRVVEKSFTVQPGGTLRAGTAGGDIVVKAGTGDRVQVIARQVVRAQTEAKADEILAKLELTIEQQGNDVVAKAKYPNSGFNFGVWPPVTVNFEVTVPASYNVELRTSGGDIRVGDLQGKVDARTSGGDIELGRIAGGVDAHTSGGDIELGAATGAVKLHTSGGDIDVGPVAGAVDVSTSGGDVKATYESGPQADASFRTSGGDVEVIVPSTAAFRIDAATSGGDVKTRGLAVTVESGGERKHKLVGTVNGGGPRLTLRTSGGNITVHAPAGGR